MNFAAALQGYFSRIGAGLFGGKPPRLVTNVSLQAVRVLASNQDEDQTMQNTRPQETSKRDARPLALHVLFVAGGDGRAAHVAAHWTKFLANGCLEVEAAAPGSTDLTAALNCAAADLVVVIHTPGDPGPLVAHNCGGRIDWDLEADVTGSPVELASQVRRHVVRLLGDLGMPPAYSDSTATHAPCPPTVFERPNRLDARASLLAA